MIEMKLEEIDNRIVSVETSFQRIINLAGTPGYDHALMVALKADLDWLKQQKAQLSGQQTIGAS
ncbi:MAG: hypothetical protein ACTHMM_03255 [Agriterribacter sp.]